jgi:hypothetical protein
MDFALAITIIARLFVYPMANRGMGWVTTVIALPFVRVQLRAVSQRVFGDEHLTSPPVRVVAQPQVRLARLTRDGTDDRATIVGRGAGAFALIGTSAWRVAKVAVGRFFPPAFWYSSSASKAVPTIILMGAVAFSQAWMRCRRVWSWFRDRPSSRARRAVGSLLAIPRSSTRVSGG